MSFRKDKMPRARFQFNRYDIRLVLEPGVKSLDRWYDGNLSEDSRTGERVAETD